MASSLWAALGLPQTWVAILTLVTAGGFYLMKKRVDQLMTIGERQSLKRFEGVYEKRMAHIEELYEDLCMIERFADPKVWSGGDPEAGRAMFEQARTFDRKLAPRRIFFSRALANQLQDVCNLTASIAARLEHGGADHEELAGLAERIETALDALEEEFKRELFGPEHPDAALNQPKVATRFGPF